ncbi:peptide methionine sulfoxide reductase, putative [Ichthyophthirius multifiliis]|uniref:peptide-methionine (S)-S-oxide reductase n=1 Tax=Ichthyophthirius multifiliis TaxID=5932 RepID=G0QQK0_ICHMU|nr:peptide methionine sulfoxide reductase, putative [Ichthyophthirius multifiliis]EGR32507.1 peptide methionine sulfoxide reductase, putative [Ichthyophthirius multifiliis]|eukprot:XP_004036493.1 peptide methionine sulfoxide reductase, putative [Ichthyophthirius multifiliis]
MNQLSNIHTFTFGGGCFWCLHAIFKRVKGVINVKSGYSSGQVKNPTYKEICTGTTGHAEVVQIEFDIQKILYENILDIFFHIHDPTQLNRQGNDIGTQYRSIILYRNQQQKEISEKILNQQPNKDKIVTEIKQFEEFYEAEEYHQDYYDQNTEQGYCKAVVSVKLKKFLDQYKQNL